MRRRKRNQKANKRRLRIQRREVPGSMPGSLSAPANASPTTIRLIAYDQDQIHEEMPETIDALFHRLERWRDLPVKWIDITGLKDIELLDALGKRLELHPLSLEDAINLHQRAKVDSYENNLFTVARSVAYEDETLKTQQISFFLKHDLLVSVKEHPASYFEPILQRLTQRSGTIRTRSADYLLYALLDAVIDNYFPVMDQLAERLDALEESVLHAANDAVLDDIHGVRNDLLQLRRTLRPHRDAIVSLSRDNDAFIDHDTQLFLRDCNDHLSQLIEIIELYRETCVGLREHHLSLVSTRMNEIMKVLTIISTIFIPLSFIAGLYGMNFNPELPGNMPELNLAYGYEYALGAMGAIVLGMLWYFWHRGWVWQK